MNTQISFKLDGIEFKAEVNHGEILHMWKNGNDFGEFMIERLGFVIDDVIAVRRQCAYILRNKGTRGVELKLSDLTKHTVQL